MPHYLKFVPRASLHTSPARARNNMAMTFDGITFDTVEELMAYKKAMGAGPSAARAPSDTYQRSFEPFRPAPGARGFGGERPLGQARAPARPARAFVVAPERAGEPVTPGQGAAITAAIGGLAALCGGEIEKGVAMSQGKNSATILTEMGLTYGTASAVIDALKKAGADGHNKDTKNVVQMAKAAAARDILFEIGGLSCPNTTSGSAKSNRGRGRW